MSYNAEHLHGLSNEQYFQNTVFQISVAVPLRFPM